MRIRLRSAFGLALCVLLLPASYTFAQSRAEYDRQRRQMVADYLEKEGIQNPRVIEAMRTVPRHEFVPRELRPKAYWDSAWPIGYKQTITWPFVVAYMTEVLDPQPGDRVLEIGTGSGYQAAVLSRLVKEVYSVEIVEPLGKAAARRLSRLGYHNVRIKIGDGYAGWPEYAPFDKIILTCSPEKIPQPLIDQLKDGGRLVAPVGSRFEQEMDLLVKADGRLIRKELMTTRFVPMTGRSDQERTARADPLHPHLHNGDFELLESNGQPSGWYYQRQMTLSERDAPEGRFCARFENLEPGRRAQALQAFPVDGRRIGALRLTLKAQMTGIADGPKSFDKAGVQIIFDDSRQLVGEVAAAHWVGTSSWHTIAAAVAVPEAAREAVIRIGLNGATGRLALDDISLTGEPR